MPRKKQHKNSPQPTAHIHTPPFKASSETTTWSLRAFPSLSAESAAPICISKMATCKWLAMQSCADRAWPEPSTPAAPTIVPSALPSRDVTLVAFGLRPLAVVAFRCVSLLQLRTPPVAPPPFGCSAFHLPSVVAAPRLATIHGHKAPTKEFVRVIQQVLPASAPMQQKIRFLTSQTILSRHCVTPSTWCSYPPRDVSSPLIR